MVQRAASQVNVIFNNFGVQNKKVVLITRKSYFVGAAQLLI